MKLRRSKPAEEKALLPLGGKRQLRKRPYIIPLGAGILALIMILAFWLGHGHQNLRPSDAHVVFLSDGGHRQVLDTKAKTVGELISKLNLHLIPEDVVEPSRDTPIPEDNFRVNIYRARPVVVIDNNSSKVVTLTAQKSARVVAKQAGLSVYPEDGVNFGQGSLKENIIGEKVVIDRSVPVALNLYGTPLSVRTRAKTVSEFLKEKNIKLAQGDSVQPVASTAIYPDTQVAVIRSGTQVTTVNEDVPPPIEYVSDASLSFGTEVVRQPGSPGKRVVTYQIQTTNGKETGRTVLQMAVIQAPVPSVVARGTVVAVTGSHESWMSAAGISSSDYGYVNFIVSRESNWNPASLNAGGCAGLGQACPGSKLANACSAWQNNPVCQLQFFSRYSSKYGGWGGAYNFWVGHHYW